MSKKRKLNKFKISILLVVLIMFFMTISGYGRFVYNNITDRYLASKKFYFTSNLLTPNCDKYGYENWDGDGVYEIVVEMCSQNNDMERYSEDLEYTVLIDYDDTDIICSLDPNNFKESTGGYTLDVYEDLKIPVETHSDKLSIYVKAAIDPETGETKKLKLGESHDIKVTAYTTEPYKKTISAIFTFKIHEVSFNVTDGINWNYVILNVRNTSNVKTDLRIDFDKDMVRLDINDSVYVENTDRVEVDGKGIVESVTFEMNKETSRNIKFYKTSDDNPMITDYDLSKIFKITKSLPEEDT